MTLAGCIKVDKVVVFSGLSHLTVSSFQVGWNIETAPATTFQILKTYTAEMKAPCTGTRCTKVIFQIYFTGQQTSRSLSQKYLHILCRALPLDWLGADMMLKPSLTTNTSRIILKHFSWLDGLQLCWRCCLLNVCSLPGGQAGEGCELHRCCSVLHGMWESNGGRTAGGQVSLHHVLGDSGAH